jgi:hypothetical protein
MANWYYYPQTTKPWTLINLDYVAQIERGRDEPRYKYSESFKRGEPEYSEYSFYIQFTFTGISGDDCGKKQPTFTGRWKTQESRDKEWELLVTGTNGNRAVSDEGK